MQKVVLLSGAVASGKSTISQFLSDHHGYITIHTRRILREKMGEDGYLSREELQALGRKLDESTGGAWVCDGLIECIGNNASANGFVLDSVRTEEQVANIRNRIRLKIVHIHLEAPESVLQERYLARAAGTRTEERGTVYDIVSSDPTELQARKLKEIADIVIDTSGRSVQDVQIRISSYLSLLSSPLTNLVDVVIGGGYGSEGKGHICSYLSPEYEVLVRVGGPNAGHRVYEHPKPYTFHHLPSGTRSSRAKLMIGPGSVIRPAQLLKEIQDCDIEPSRLVIDHQAMIIEDADLEAEQELVRTIGSTGQGVGHAAARRILERNRPATLARDISDLKPFVGDVLEELESAYATDKRILLEGTQGTGLSLFHGHYPYVTSRDTTVSGVLSEAGIPPSRVRRVLMVVRSYPIRVENPINGDSGPLKNEVTWGTIAERSGIPLERLLESEKTSTTNRKRRVGEFDWELFRRACLLNGPTDIVLTFVDYLNAGDGRVRRFEELSLETLRFIDQLERVAQAPVSLISNGFGHLAIMDRRTWRK